MGVRRGYGAVLKPKSWVYWVIAVLSVVSLCGCRPGVSGSGEPEGAPPAAGASGEPVTVTPPAGASAEPVTVAPAAGASGEPVTDASGGTSRPYVFVGSAGGTSVTILAVDNEERPFEVEVTREGQTQRYKYWAAALESDGTVLMAGVDEGLVALGVDGTEKQLLKPGEVGFQIALDPSGRYLAFQYPVEWGDNIVLKGGVGVYDLVNGSRSLLYYKDPPGMFSVLGWFGESIVFCGPHLADILAVDQDGSVRVLAQLSARVRTYLPMRGTMLPYEIIGGGVGVVDLSDPDLPREFPDASDPGWTQSGLEVLMKGQRETILELGP